MAPLSLKIVIDDGAVTRTLMFDTSTKVAQAHLIVRDKILTLDPDKEYGFFLQSADNDCSGVWLENDRALDYYMLREGDFLQYLPKLRNLRFRMLDDTVKTLQVDESKKIGDLMFFICNKIGITNHEEYGLCDTEEVEETSKPSTGTLTLKRAAQREKDAELQQLIKKFKTDNNVEWLDHHKTLRELRVDPKKTLLLKRRLFYSDRNVDSRDPLQLNLLYVQTRDAILDGTHVVTEDKAVEFAGLQCQVQYGDFQEEKHKSGFIENLKEFLPSVFASSWGVEKKVFREHRKHSGLSPLEAKHLYIKMARVLPTYGVTFFVVKEKQKGKKKLVPRLLGINSESILRLDEQTKEILQIWPLTQVKSYRASTETFTLNFGDYSDKEYAVKTNEGYRIKDILEGYIDIIRKRLAAPRNVCYTEGEVIMEENISSSRGSTIVNYAPKMVETHSLVGPSQIITVEQGLNMTQGTNITTVHQIQMTRTTNQGGMNAVKGGYSTVIEELSRDRQAFGKKLNFLNSESVKAVLLLSEPTKENIEQVRDIAQNMENSLPDIIKGVKEIAAKLNETESKKLLEELDELCGYINTLSRTSKDCDLSDPDKLMTAQNAAKKIADLSTQIYFSLDPKTKRRSKLILSSRDSFIADEKTSATLRRASFLTAADSANTAVESAHENLQEIYQGPIPDAEEIAHLENDAIDKMGKLNAAVAQLLIAHADPKNVDYEMAVNSMKAIHDCVPQLVDDAKILSVTKDEPHRSELLNRIKELLDRTKNICMLTGTDDSNKMQEPANKFADLSKKLIFTFGHRNPNLKLENTDKEIKDLVMAVGNKASQLLLKVNELSQVAAEDPSCEQVDKCAVKCADAVQALLACARLTAPTIQEPHCQSALLAAIENLSSSSQALSVSWKPVVEKPGHNIFGIQLTEHSLKLAKALENLKSFYSNLNGEIQEEKLEVQEEQPEQQLTSKQKKRLKFISSLSSAKEGIEDATKDLENIKPKVHGSDPNINKKETKRGLADKLAQLNAAIASLLQATADPDNHNISRAQRAINTIQKLTPTIVDDAKSLNGNIDQNAWNMINAELKSMFEVVKDICDNATENDGKALKENISKYAKASSKLTNTCKPRNDVKEENNHGALDLSRSACEQTSAMLSKVYQLAESVGGEQGHALDQAGAKVVDAAQALLSTAEVTAPSMNDPRCQASVISAVENQSLLAKDLEKLWNEILNDRAHNPLKEDLQKDSENLQDILNKIRDLCQTGVGHIQEYPSKLQYLIGDEKQRLQFGASLSAAKNAVHEASRDLENTKIKNRGSGPKDDVPETKKRLAERLAQLNAAIASLMQVTANRENVNMRQAESGIEAIRQLTPDIVNTVKALNGNINEDAWKEVSGELKTMLDAAKSICDDTNESNLDNINDILSKFTNSSGKLIQVLNPDISKEREKQVLELSRKACAQTSVMLSKVYQLVEDVGGEEGEVLELAGEKVVDAAQTLLTTAQITAPSLNDSRCQVAVTFAADNHMLAAKDLEKKWKETVQNPEYRHYEDDLQNSSRKLQDTLDILRNKFEFDTDESQNSLPEKQRLKFITSLSNAKNAIDDASKDLEDRGIQDHGSATKINVRETQRRLANKLAQLNAAIASLMQATADRQNPDINLAESATETICRVTPDIVKAVKSLNGNMDEEACKAINEDLKCMLKAAKDICDNPTNSEMDIQDIVSKFANSSGKLMFTFNPRVKTKKEKQALDLSRSACEQTSVMLSKVDQLAESVGGEQEQVLDEAGAKVIDDAQTLLMTAKITAPSINDARSKASLVSAVDRQSVSAKELDRVLEPVVQNPQYRHYKDDLQKDSQGVQDTLDKLRDLCQTNTGTMQEHLSRLQQSIGDEKKRLQFISSLSSAKNAVDDASKDLQSIKRQVPGSTTTAKAQEIKRRLADRLAQLNAAIASLTQATADHENPDIKLAERAIETIGAVAPDIIKDAVALSGNVDDKSWKEISEDLKCMLEATGDLCENSSEINTKDINDTLSKFAAASGNLAHVLDSAANYDKEKQVLDLSRSACEQTSVMLTKVYQLAESVDEGEGQLLDVVGAKVADAAQALLVTAELTAATINDARCQASLISAVDNQSLSTKELERTWEPIVEKTENQQYKDDLKKRSFAVQDTLGKLKDICQDSVSEADCLQLNSSLSSAKKVIDDANKALECTKKQDHGSTPKINVRETQRKLADKLAQLNAAIASILQATADQKNPDFKLADSAINTVHELVPVVVNDVKLLNGNVSENFWTAIVDNLKCTLDATSAICDNAQNKDTNEAVYKLGKSSAKLMNIVSPRNNVKKEKEVLDLSRSACEQTSVMLSKVNQLAESVGEEEGQALDQAGAKVVDAAQTLLSISKITAPMIKDAQCQAALISAANNHSLLAKKLENTWKPILQKTEYRQYTDDLQKDSQLVQTTLDKLRKSCRTDPSQHMSHDEELDVPEAKENLSKLEKLLDGKIKKTMPTGTKITTEVKTIDDPSSARHRLLLSQKLAKLNDAIAQLVQAFKMSDRGNPDHKTAQVAITTLSKLTPEIVQDIITLDQNVDGDCSQMLEEARLLCKASTDICASVEENDVQGINGAAIEYANHSNKLRFIFNPWCNPTQINQILESVRSVCERTSLMLSRVSRLADLVEPAASDQLHNKGAAVGDAAQSLLTTAQVTASSINDGGCKSRLISSADKLLSSSQDLRKIWKLLVQNEICYSIGEQLYKDQDMLQIGVNQLKATCENINDEELLRRKSAMKEKEKLIIEDCPLKQMARKILLTAQAKSKSNSIPPQEQKLLTEFCNKLENVLKDFDIANAKCRNQPIDAKRRSDLESVIVNLQQMCLFSKNLGAEESYIVDLANYVNYVTSAAEDVIQTTYNITPTTNHVKEVKSESQKIIQEAAKLLNGFNSESTEITDDIMKYDHFGKLCEDRVKNMIEMTHEMPDGKSKIVLQEKVQILKENTDLLRFAAKCNLSTAMGVSVDETLDNLTDIEQHIEEIIKPLPGLQIAGSAEDVKSSVINAQEALVSSLVSSDNIPKAFAEYTLQMRSAVQPYKNYKLKLKDHLKRLADLLKSQVAVKGRMVATWQDVHGAETTAITDKIIQELDSFNQDGSESKSDASLAVSNEYKNLLMSRNHKISGDNGVLLDKFQKDVNKLSINANTIVLSSHQPESLARCLHMISETASQVVTTAKSIKTENPMVEKQIEDAAQHLCKATYKVLKVAQSLQRTPNHADGRRRLQEACRLLNDSINRLVRTVLPGDKQREGDEMSRLLQMQGAFLKAKLPANALGYNDCLDALQSQQDIIQKLESDQSMTKTERTESLTYITSAICNATEYATQTAYLLSLSKDCRDIVEHGLVDIPRLKKITETLRDDCMSLLYCGDAEQIKHIKSEISKQTEMLQKTLDDNSSKIKEDIRIALQEDIKILKCNVKLLQDTAHSTNEKDNMGSRINGICKVVDAINKINNTIDKIEEPQHDNSSQLQNSSQEIVDNTRDLVKKMSSLSKKAVSSDEDSMTWVVFGGADVVRAFEKLVNCVRQKGIDAEILASTKHQQEEVPVKSYMQIQIDLAKKWLQHPAAKPEVKTAGIKGIQYAIEMADKITEDLRDAEKEDMKQVVMETKQLLAECTQKYNSDNASLLMERLKELQKMLERGVVTRVVEDFLQDPIIDMDALVSKEQDKNKRKFILERKIAELQAQLGKVTQTVRLVADTGSGHARRDLIDTSNKVELLAPSLVKAAQQRLESPENKEAIEKYMMLVEQYAKTIALMRDLCDRAVDPIDFAQAAGDTMQRIKEENSANSDPHTCTLTSKMILRLGNRVIEAGMNSAQVKKDPEMQSTLKNIKKAIDSNQSEGQADWRAIFAEILQKTSQVESVLGGENIFNRQPEPDQPIYAAALDLHAAVREWSARDNDIVAGAKRMAVLMAKLSHNMETDNKRELIFTSKAIVSGAAEVAALARKLALECTDMRIRTNLLQVCDKIPTISGQLKILTTVKGSSLGHQGTTEDQEAMNMLVCNAQNLMTSIQEVVKAAASASVKIMSQRGCRMKWVRRKNYY